MHVIFVQNTLVAINIILTVLKFKTERKIVILKFPSNWILAWGISTYIGPVTLYL